MIENVFCGYKTSLHLASGGCEPIKSNLRRGAWCDPEWSRVGVWSAALSVWLCKNMMRWWNAGSLFQGAASLRAGFWMCSPPTLHPPGPVGKPTLQLEGNGSIPSSQLEATAADRVSPFFLVFFLHQHQCLSWSLLSLPTWPAFVPSLPHLAAYYTRGENKQFPCLIIHITFIWYSVTMGNLVVE